MANHEIIYVEENSDVFFGDVEETAYNFGRIKFWDQFRRFQLQNEISV